MQANIGHNNSACNAVIVLLLSFWLYVPSELEKVVTVHGGPLPLFPKTICSAQRAHIPAILHMYKIDCYGIMTVGEVVRKVVFSHLAWTVRLGKQTISSF